MQALKNRAPESDAYVSSVANSNGAGPEAIFSRREGPNLRRLPGVIFEFRLFPDGRTCFPYAAPQIADLCGVTPEEIREDAYPVFYRIDADDLELMRDSILDSAVTMKKWVVTFRANLEDGRKVRLRAESSPEALWDGSVLWHGYLADVTHDFQAPADPHLADGPVALTTAKNGEDDFAANRLALDLAAVDAEALNVVFRD